MVKRQGKLIREVDQESVLNGKFEMPVSHLRGNFKQVVIQESQN